jgi:conjugal transfer/entry exclusion protein
MTEATMTDWETRYYEAQASHTEANGMLTMERDHWKAKAEGLRESMRLDAETMAAKDAEIARLTSCISETVNERDEARGAAVKANRAVERLLPHVHARAVAARAMNCAAAMPLALWAWPWA